MITVKNRSYNALTEGVSASAAVGLVAAWRGDHVKPDVALTGKILPDGRIEPVGGLLTKIEGAARAQFAAVLVPQGQPATIDRDFLQTGNPMEYQSHRSGDTGRRPISS